MFTPNLATQTLMTHIDLDDPNETAQVAPSPVLARSTSSDADADLSGPGDGQGDTEGWDLHNQRGKKRPFDKTQPGSDSDSHRGDVEAEEYKDSAVESESDNAKPAGADPDTSVDSVESADRSDVDDGNKSGVDGSDVDDGDESGVDGSDVDDGDESGVDGSDVDGDVESGVDGSDVDDGDVDHGDESGVGSNVLVDEEYAATPSCDDSSAASDGSDVDTGDESNLDESVTGVGSEEDDEQSDRVLPAQQSRLKRVLGYADMRQRYVDFNSSITTEPTRMESLYHATPGPQARAIKTARRIDPMSSIQLSPDGDIINGLFFGATRYNGREPIRSPFGENMFHVPVSVLDSCELYFVDTWDYPRSPLNEYCLIVAVPCGHPAADDARAQLFALPDDNKILRRSADDGWQGTQQWYKWVEVLFLGDVPFSRMTQAKRSGRLLAAARKLKPKMDPNNVSPEDRKEMEEHVEAFKALQAEMAELSSRRQQLVTQITENGMVKDELDQVDEENQVYKLVGPCLIGQDLDEAKSDVQRRIEFIEGEMKRLDEQVAAKNTEIEAARDRVVAVQQRIQKAAAEEAAAEGEEGSA